MRFLLSFAGAAFLAARVAPAHAGSGATAHGPGHGSPADVTVTVDATVGGGTAFAHFWEQGVGSGHAALTTRADWREHMKMAHDELGFQYVRYHGVFNDGSMYFDAPHNNQRASYHDPLSTYSYLVSIGVKPVVELSFTPSPVNNGTCNHFYYNGCETIPTNYTLYAEYVRNFTAVCVDYFGIDEVSTWYFEVYNEADLHWSFDEYFLLYTAAARAVRSVSPRLRVGGPASAFPVWVGKLVEACENHSVPLDFVSSHGYPTTGGARNAEMKGLIKQVTNGRDGAGPNRTLLITEWNGVCNSRGSWHDETAQGAFVVAAMDAISNIAPPPDMFAYWAVSDVFTEQGLPSDSVAFHGGFGLVSLYGIRKPGYRAFQLLHNAGDWRLGHTTTDANITVLPLVTKDDPTKMRLLLASNGYVGEPVPNRTVTIHIKRPTLQDAGRPASTPTEAGKAVVWRIDEAHTNPKALWLQMGSPDYLKPIQVKQLNARSELVAGSVVVEGDATGWVVQAVDLPAFGVVAIDLELTK